MNLFTDLVGGSLSIELLKQKIETVFAILEKSLNEEEQKNELSPIMKCRLS